jgi:hypothetical protein
MAHNESFASKFMRVTGKARFIFGPAQSSSLDHAMTEENKELLHSQQEESAQQWETVRRADGSTYIVPRKP